jgi:hypothetical protein
MGILTGEPPQLVQSLRSRTRQTLDRIDNEQVRRARGLVRALRQGQPDVLYLGDSEMSFVAPYDTDRRRLGTMVADDLGPAISVRAVHGPSFNPDIFDAYLGLLRGTSHRPLVVVPLWTRGRFTPWIEHPVHGHKRATAAIRQIDPTRSSWRIHRVFAPPTQEEFDQFGRVLYETLLGEGTVDDYVAPIREHLRSGDEDRALRALYAYHYGGLLRAGSPEVEAVTRMGRTIRELGCAAVVYQTPIPVQMGAELLGPELAERTAESYAVLNEAYRLGAGEDSEIIESGTCFATDEFIDPNDATEHLNERGRRRLSGLVTDAIRRRLGMAGMGGN